MKIIDELLTKNLFTLILAPVASGKTKLIIDFYQNQNCKIVFVSPLRALANEVFDKLKNELNLKNVFICGKSEKNHLSDFEAKSKFLESSFGILLTTMELLSEDFLDELKSRDVIFVLDEFHLIYHWGEGFRPVLHDRFLGILDTECPVLGLTATMSDMMLEKVSNDLCFHNDQWVLLDFGNQKLHRPPQNIYTYQYLNKKIFTRTLWRELKNKKHTDVFLIFCSYRSEVDEEVDRAKRMGFRAIGCVGGEVEQFQKSIESMENRVDCIFATTTLSHGVNLPEISKVFINYEVKNFDFWLQMIGRGGRRGAPYDVHSFDNFNFLKRDILKSTAIIYINDLIGVKLID